MKAHARVLDSKSKEPHLMPSASDLPVRAGQTSLELGTRSGDEQEKHDR